LKDKFFKKKILKKIQSRKIEIKKRFKFEIKTKMTRISRRG
jgi:hypothetical protein